MVSHSRARLTRPGFKASAVGLGCLVLAGPAGLRAAAGLDDAAPVQDMEAFVTSATRTPTDIRNLGSMVDRTTGEDLARRQITSLSQAIAGFSAPVFASGQNGALTSIFLRGANSNQTLFLVDGLRINDPSTDYQVFLGGACVGACDSLEISHGPQSTLYGGEAVGGVISLRSERGRGAPSVRTAVEAGSFGTLQGAVSAQGASGPWAYQIAAQGGHTENDRPNNDFDSGNFTARIDRAVTANLDVGGTVRGFQAVYGSPGDRYTNDPDNQETEGNWLGTVFADVRPSEVLQSHVILGGQNRRYVSESPRAGRATSITVVKNRRGVLDWQNTFTGIARNKVTAGLTAEANHTRNTGFGDINEKQTLLAFFAQDEYSPIDTVFLTAGLRSDDFDTFGQHTTGRATAAWRFLPDWKLRSSYGTAFRSPSFLDLYGRSAYYVGNPNLNPERARGQDFGLDYSLPEKRGTLGVTWFDTRFRDLIVYNFAQTPSTMANVDRARTRGLEVASTLTPFGEANRVSLSYTYLEAENSGTGARLLRRPRHSGNIDLWHDFGSGFSAGVGGRVVAQREDVDARTFRTIDGEDYTVIRVYAAWQATKSLAVKARVENALDEKYEEVNGYPQLPVGAFVGLEWKL